MACCSTMIKLSRDETGSVFRSSRDDARLLASKVCIKQMEWEQDSHLKKHRVMCNFLYSIMSCHLYVLNIPDHSRSILFILVPA